MSVFERGVRLGRRSALLAAWLAVLAAESTAADKLWDNPNGGVFTLASNWFGGVPGLNDLARFEITNSTSFPRTYTVAFANDPTNQQLVVEDDNVTFNLIGSPSNHTYELKNEFVAVALGTVAGRSGNLTVRRGTLKLPSGSDLEIAPVAGASGVLTVDVGGAVLGAPNVAVGLNGNGTLNINSGGDVTANDVRIGVKDGSMGTLNVKNGGHIEISGDLHLSSFQGSGNGTLLIEAGGIVAVTGGTLVASQGKLRLEGGTFINPSVISLVSTGQFSWTAGTLQVGEFWGNLVVPNGGVLVPRLPTSSSPTGTRVDGSYNQQADGAVLAVDISGKFTFGKLAVDDTALLGGSLQVLLKEGFVPSPSDTYEILQSEDLVGAFANVANGQRLMTSDGLGSFVVNYGPGNPLPDHVILSAFAPGSVLPGDYNQDGTIDTADYVVWRNNLGSGTSLPNDDTAGVGPDDYTRWRKNFGLTPAAGLATSNAASFPEAVPEPSILNLSLVAIFILAMKRVR